MQQVLIIDPWRDSVLSLGPDLEGNDQIRAIRVENFEEASKIFNHVDIFASIWFCNEMSALQEVKRLDAKTKNLIVVPPNLLNDSEKLSSQVVDHIIKSPINLNEIKKSLSYLSSIEDILKEGSKSYIDLFERSNDAILLIDPESEALLDMNLKATSFFGLELKEVQSSLQWFELATQESQKEFKSNFRRSKRNYYAKTFELKFQTKSDNKDIDDPDSLIEKGVRYGQVSMGIIVLKNKDTMQIVIRDITEKKLADLKLDVMMKNIQMANTKLEELTITDPLTKIYNRRHFENTLDVEFTKSSRHGIPISLLYMDIDNFKNFNDKNGHQAGDELLVSFADLLKRVCRRNYTIVARLGGEEFVVLLPCIDKEGAIVLGNKVHKALNETKFKFGENQPLGRVTASIGIAEFPSDCSTKEQLVQFADEAMYYGKTHGRNKVAFYPLPKDPENKSA